MNQKKTRQGLTWKDAADVFGVSRSTIQKWRDKDWLVRFSDRSIDPDATLHRVDKLRAGDPGINTVIGNENSGEVSFHEARRRKMVADANKAEYELEQLRGSLIEVSVAEGVYSDRLTKARVNIEAIPTRIAAVIAGMTDPGEIRDLLRREIEIALLAASKPSRPGQESSERGSF